jgi:hypothetical protein
MARWIGQAAFTISTSVGRLYCFTSIFLVTGSDAAGHAKMKFLLLLDSTSTSAMP